ncbi:MAG: hypothetical protein ACRC0W_04370 [Cetobacterium sp.]
MGKINTKKLSNNGLLLLLSGMAVLLTQKVGMGSSIIEGIPGMLMILAVALGALIIKELFPKSIFPAFGWVTILGFLMSIPYNPLSKVFMEYTGKINFMAITTPLLTFAGISVGSKIEELKSMSWKIVLISVLVFISIFFACALIAEAVLKLRGEI